MELVPGWESWYLEGMSSIGQGRSTENSGQSWAGWGGTGVRHKESVDSS